MSNSNNNRNRNKGGQGNQRRRRGRPGGRDSGGNAAANIPRGPVMTSLGESTYEAVFDHGNEGYGVWFDGMVKDDPVYKRNWKGNRPIFVRLEEDQIIISRTLPGRDDDQDDQADDVADIGNAVAVQIDFDDDAPAFVMDPDPADELDDAAPTSSDERVYSPEEAAQLFAAEAADAADAAEAAAEAAEAASEVSETTKPEKPKSPPARRRVSTRKKKPAAEKDSDE